MDALEDGCAVGVLAPGRSANLHQCNLPVSVI